MLSAWLLREAFVDAVAYLWEVHKASIVVADATKENMAKLVFHVVGMDNTGIVVLRKRLAQSALRHLIATLLPLRIGVAAFGETHL